MPCTARSLFIIRSNFTRFRTTLPTNRTGPDPKITPTMADALIHQISRASDMKQHGMVDFMYEKFGEEVTYPFLRLLEA
jgi:hypothetical protein